MSKKKKKLPAEWRVVDDKYKPKDGETKTYSTDFGWVVTGSKKPAKTEFKGVKHGG